MLEMERKWEDEKESEEKSRGVCVLENQRERGGL